MRGATPSPTRHLLPPPRLDVQTARSPMPAQAAGAATRTHDATSAQIAWTASRAFAHKSGHVVLRSGATAFFVFGTLLGRESSPYPTVR